MSDRAVQELLPLDGRTAAEPEDAPEDAMAIPLDARDEPLARASRQTPEAAPEPGELIEPGRALVLTDFVPPEVTAGERMTGHAEAIGQPHQPLAGGGLGRGEIAQHQRAARLDQFAGGIVRGRRRGLGKRFRTLGIERDRHGAAVPFLRALTPQREPRLEARVAHAPRPFRAAMLAA